MIKYLFFFAGFLFLTLFLNQKIKTVMAALDDLKAAVQKETEVDQSAIVLLNGLKAQLDAAIASTLRLCRHSAISWGQVRNHLQMRWQLTRLLRNFPKRVRVGIKPALTCLKSI